MRHEGIYILKTVDPDPAATDAVAAYKELSTVEWGFRDLKDVIATPRKPTPGAATVTT